MYKPVNAPPVQRLSSIVAQQLEDMIVRGEFLPGESLISERELAKQIGVSRPSLREALTELRSRGLIEMTRNRGAVIADLTKATFADPLAQLLERHPQSIHNLIEVRIILETQAAALAAIRSKKSDLDRIEKALRAHIRGRSRNTATLTAFDFEFHKEIALASHNIILSHTIHGMSDLITAFVQRGYEKILKSADPRKEKSAIEQQHTAIFEAIRKGDPEAARAAVDVHLRLTEVVWTEELPVV